LSYDPPIAGAPATLDSAEVANFESTKPFVVKSQDDKHPFYVTQIMGGASGVNITSRPGCNPMGSTVYPHCNLGNDEAVPMLPPAQFMNQFGFFTDPGLGTTNLVFVRKKGAWGFEDVTLDCLNGVIIGWVPVGTSGQYETISLDLVRATTPNGWC